MLPDLTHFLLHRAITAFALWVAGHVFKGLRFTIQTGPAAGPFWL
ncbi:hypothetical protein QRO11_09335 [Paracidovorax citrulli]|uniref:DoxX family membrane protein n=1 Tax=Paracidovorax citrulli TaxID=80869 RepID=A0ABY9AV44_PARCI|nr:hypothetical protein [Paracidovorax citrulli]PVY67093.1 hypothetical protein C8E08_4525 [Paracidovorax citrulli]REG68744.1 hypothetical protein C8E07_1866 [Paracidovorax citrulli]RLJ93299.1 hypothetical protein C8E06_1866 [Paracidovorax citrulli]WIY31202.1 hypothetical protein QRO09_05635 [Paracidovorax citrulli]WIY36503.1 hypothetical protein QRO11_09335 [Paracidovorax citrulli]